MTRRHSGRDSSGSRPSSAGCFAGTHRLTDVARKGVAYVGAPIAVRRWERRLETRKRDATLVRELVSDSASERAAPRTRLFAGLRIAGEAPAPRPARRRRQRRCRSPLRSGVLDFALFQSYAGGASTPSSYSRSRCSRDERDHHRDLPRGRGRYVGQTAGIRGAVRALEGRGRAAGREYTGEANAFEPHNTTNAGETTSRVLLSPRGALARERGRCRDARAAKGGQQADRGGK